jgi:hypothetical protein
VNFSELKSQSLQHGTEDLSYIVNLEDDFVKILNSVTYTDFHFNKDSKEIQDLDLLSDILANKLLKNKFKIEVKPLNFRFANEFGLLNNDLQKIEMAIGEDFGKFEFKISKKTTEEIQIE